MTTYNLTKFKSDFAILGENYKTKDVDKFNKMLIKNNIDVSFLKDIILLEQQYHRTYFQVSLGQLTDINSKFNFIEDNFDKLQNWWHVDQLTQFVKKYLTFDFAYKKSSKYITNNLPFVRRWGYVMFLPNLIKNIDTFEYILLLLKNDDNYYVQMAEAWLISYLGIYHPQKTLEYLSKCPLKYNISGKAIQKICDSFRISNDNKLKFKNIRKNYK